MPYICSCLLYIVVVKLEVLSKILSHYSLSWNDLCPFSKMSSQEPHLLSPQLKSDLSKKVYSEECLRGPHQGTQEIHSLMTQSFLCS